MIGRLWTAYTVELFKAMRLKQTYLGPGLVLAVILATPGVHRFSQDHQSDYRFIAYVTPLALGLLGLLLLLTYCAGLIAGELANGSIRSTLLRPLRRHEYVLAKLMLGMTYAVALTAVTAAGSWSIAYAFGDLTGVNVGGELLYTAEQMQTAYAFGALLSLLPQFAAAAFAIMISTITRSPSAAVSGTVGLWIVLDLLKNPLHLEPYFFSTYLESPFQIFINRCDAIEIAWSPMLWYCIGTSITALIVFTSIAILVMRRRNLTA